MTKQNAWSEIEAVIEGKSLLKHPFYRAWTAGTLTRGDLTHYARQYFAQEAMFSRFLSAVHSNCDDLKARQAMIENLRHEEEGPDNHAELWLRFAEAVGASRESVRGAELSAETGSCVAAFKALTGSRNWAAGLAALYAYEAQQPVVAETKITGLRAHYGVDSAEGLEFFKVHAEADRWHSEAEKQILLDRIERNPGLLEEMKSSASKACDALNTLLDGVCAARGISCSMGAEAAREAAAVQ